MNGRLRLILCGACVAIGVLHAPWSTHVLSQDLTGTYHFVVRADRTEPPDANIAAARKGTESEVKDVSRADEHHARTAPVRR